MTSKILIAASITALSLCGSSPAHAQSSTAGPAIDRDAMAALDKMGAYLRSLNAFQIRSITATDEVGDDGQKIQSDGVVDLLIQRPDRLRAEITSDAQHRMFFYDGKTFSIWARRVNYYATAPAPPTLAELSDRLYDKYGIDLPLADLFYWGSEKSDSSRIRSATNVGPSQVDGVSCQHYAFRQEGLDWQLWVQNGDYPLPRKLVLTTTSDEARPQYTTVMSWNLAPAFDGEAFTFVPPPDAHKIVFGERR
jgi:hypothetical protein